MISASAPARRKSPRVIVDVGGVGYDVLVPLSTFYFSRDGAALTFGSTRTSGGSDRVVWLRDRLEQDLFEG